MKKRYSGSQIVAKLREANTPRGLRHYNLSISVRYPFTTSVFAGEACTFRPKTQKYLNLLAKGVQND